MKWIGYSRGELKLTFTSKKTGTAFIEEIPPIQIELKKMMQRCHQLIADTQQKAHMRNVRCPLFGMRVRRYLLGHTAPH